MLLSQLWQSLAHFIDPLQTPIGSNAVSSQPADFPPFALSETWSVLGPFQIGTREAIWGSDPLEQHGGFRSLEYHRHTTFRSSLAANGVIGWSNYTAKLSDPNPRHAGAELVVGFPHIDWQGLRDVYGWAALQWQAWVRGEIIVQSEETEILTLYTPQVLEFWIDDAHYFGGDFYSYERAPVTLRLSPGIHRIDVRLVRDVRAMGGVGEPNVEIKLDLQKSYGLLHPVLQPNGGVLISDCVGDDKNAVLASPYASITVRDDAHNDIEVYAVEANHNACVAELISDVVRLVPGQTRPIPFRIKCVSPTVGYPFIILDFRYRIEGEEEYRTLSMSGDLNIVPEREPHKVTFMHPGGIVSYAILRPPSTKATEVANASDTLPVLLALHGAGVEAENYRVKHAMDPVPDLGAWVLFPTGGTPWSGDDWHAWGFADVEAAVAMIPGWIKQVEWRRPGVDVDKWLVSGHSNGGQGTWYALTHRPDKVFAASPLSGYSSIQNYVPYTFWHAADPGRTAVVQSALLGYRHEHLLSNAKGIPVLQQHGSADENVPPYHSRLMSQLIREGGADSQFIEFPGKPHTWDDMFTTKPLKKFYHDKISSNTVNATDHPPNLQDFSLVVANPGDTGPKYGFHVLQLAVPGQLGRVDVLFDPLTAACILRTTNIRMFYLPLYFRDCSFVLVDEQNITLPLMQEEKSWTLSNAEGSWNVQNEVESRIPPVLSRRGRQLGPMDSILRTEGLFSVVTHSGKAAHISLQISRNLAQYFAADTAITTNYSQALESTGNIISIAIGPSSLPPGYHPNHPIQIDLDGGIYIRGLNRRFDDVAGLGLSSVFLRPLPLGRLELVVWGSTEASLDIAARLVPIMPGSGQPDFVIADQSMLWSGLEGVLAMGFFDSSWEVSGNRFSASV